MDSSICTLKEFGAASRKYALALLSLLPGYVIGGPIVVPWVILALMYSLQGRTLAIAELFVLWTFLGEGAYQYHLLGSAEGENYVFYVQTILLVTAIVTFLLSPKKESALAKRLRFLGYTMILASVISGFVNYVDMQTLVKYLETYSWFFFSLAVLMSFSYQYSVKKLASLIVAILVMNSVLGFLQTTILPIQTTPDGYTPHLADAAVGLLGVGASQMLTDLCIAFASYFILDYLMNRGKKNLGLAMLLAIQPVVSESKAARLIGVALFIVVFLLALLRYRIISMNLKSLPKYAILVAVLWFGFKFSNNLNESYFESSGGQEATISKFLSQKEALMDFGKIRGYVDAFTMIAPRGNLGLAFGLGPRQFMYGMLENVPLFSNLGFIMDQGTAGRKSSVDFAVTDITVIIGELGFIGFFFFCFGILRILLFYGRKISQANGNQSKLSSLFIVQLILLVSWNSFYYTGWDNALYFVPLTILMAVDQSISEGESRV